MGERLTCDVLVIGAGIAGASLAYELGNRTSVIIAEREPHPGYHTTGRSAAAYIPSYCYEQRPVHQLTACSRQAFLEPDPAFCASPLLKPRGALSIADADFLELLRSEYTERQKRQITGEWLDTAAIKSLVPQLADEYAQAAIFEADVADIDVHALHDAYLRGVRKRGGKLMCDQPIITIDKQANGWLVRTSGKEISTPIIANTAGAWADEIAALAEAAPIGLEPKRRTAILIDPPAEAGSDRWPLVAHIGEQFYLRPDAGKLMVSPADETPSPPCDAQPGEMDVAYAAHYAEKALGNPVKAVLHSWAGLRSFAPDRIPVIGYADETEGFFWFAGQGGFGIQTAPAAARLAAALLLSNSLPQDLVQEGLETSNVSPVRQALQAQISAPSGGVKLPGE